jgi:uncharacterized membrane protein YgcG
VQRITDEQGRALGYTATGQDGNLQLLIDVDGAVDATKTIVLQYRVVGALRFFKGHDELYWNVVGLEWEVPIHDARASVWLPESATGARALLHTGVAGSRDGHGRASIEGSRVHFRTERRLRPREAFTVAVGWHKGVVQEPSFLARLQPPSLATHWPFLIPFGVFGLLLVYWLARSRGAPMRPITVQYEPPDNLTPAEVGALFDNSVDMRDITATIVDLAVRGFLVLQAELPAGAAALAPRALLQRSRSLLRRWLSSTEGCGADPDYLFIARRERSEWARLREHEKRVLAAIFPGKSRQRRLSELGSRFAGKLPAIKKAIVTSLLAHQYYRGRLSVRGRWIAAGLPIGFVLTLGGEIYSEATNAPTAAWLFAGPLTAAIIVTFGFLMSSRSEQGVRALEHVLGLRSFLSRVDAERFNRELMSPQKFERLLPYAMALGVEKQWSAMFQSIYQQQADWFVPGAYDLYEYRARGLTDHVSVMSAQVESSFKAHLHASESSAFGSDYSSSSSNDSSSSSSSAGSGSGGGGGGGF